MKKIILILAGAASLLAFASCNKEAEYKQYPFARFDSGSSVSVKEDAGSVTFPVTVYNNDGLSGSVTFEVSGSAVSGVNYTIEPASGVLNFTGNGTQEITISVINIPDTFTGNFDLTVSLTGVSGDITLGAPRSKKLTIVDNDVKVDWDYLEGLWTAGDFTLDGAADGGAYEAYITKVDDTNLKLTNLWGGGYDIVGTVEFDEAANTATILFPAQQTVYYYGPYGNMILLGTNAAGNWSYSPAVGVVSADGVTIGPWNMLITEGTYAGYLYSSGYYTILTK